jgi:type II secretory pathway pseudopilin PulG
MKTKRGFTVLELIIAIVFVGIFVVLFFLQKINIDAMERDQERKIAINAMFYSLEEGFYQQNSYYPEVIFEDNLTTMDPNLFTDPQGFNIGDANSSYRYEPINCKDGKCQQYILRAIMEKEDIYIKSSRH